MNGKLIVMASACVALASAFGEVPCATPCSGTNKCECACRGERPPAPLTLKIEKGTTDADVAAYKTAVLARIDETLAKAKAKCDNDKCPPITIRLVTDCGRPGMMPGMMPPPPKCGRDAKCGRGGKGCPFGARPGDRPELPPQMGEPPMGEPPAEPPMGEPPMGEPPAEPPPAK